MRMSSSHHIATALVALGASVTPARAEMLLPGLATNASSETYVTLPWVYPFTGTPDKGEWSIFTGCDFASTGCANPDTTHTWHHTGEDWHLHNAEQSAGKSVYAANNGVVVWAGLHDQGTGYVVIIRHDAPPGTTISRPPFDYDMPNDPDDIHIAGAQVEHIYSYYLHLDEIDPSVLQNPGTSSFDPAAPLVWVRKGQQIGKLFAVAWPTYRSYSAHLHFEMWLDARTDARGVPYDSNGYDTSSEFRQAVATLLPASTFYTTNNQGLFVSRIRDDGTGLLELQGNGVTAIDGAALELKTSPDSWASLVRLTPTGASGSAMMVSLTYPWIFSRLAPRKLFTATQVNTSARLRLTTRAPATNDELRYPLWFPFMDVEPATAAGVSRFYARPAVDLWKNGVVEGYQDYNLLSPLARISRVEFLALTVRALRLPMAVDPANPAEACRRLSSQNTPPGPFSDIQLTDTYWYCPYVLAAYEHQNPNNENLGERRVVDSQGLQHRLNPEELVGRADAARMLANSLDLQVLTAATSDPFRDVPQSQWYAKYAVAVHDAGIMIGPGDGTWEPERALRRGEAVTVIDRARVACFSAFCMAPTMLACPEASSLFLRPDRVGLEYEPRDDFSNHSGPVVALDGPAEREAADGEIVPITVSAADPDGDPLHLSWRREGSCEFVRNPCDYSSNYDHVAVVVHGGRMSSCVVMAYASDGRGLTGAAKVSFKQDDDGDGVTNDLDAFPEDPEEAGDADGDGRGDRLDLCPNTRAGVVVNQDGCSIGDLAAPCAPYENRGEFQRRVVEIADAFMKACLISGAEGGDVKSRAARLEDTWVGRGFVAQGAGGEACQAVDLDVHLSQRRGAPQCTSGCSAGAGSGVPMAGGLLLLGFYFARPWRRKLPPMRSELDVHRANFASPRGSRAAARGNPGEVDER